MAGEKPVITRKKDGRPRVVESDLDRARIGRLYFLDELTPKEIRALPEFSHVKEGTIRQIARTWKLAQDGAA